MNHQQYCLVFGYYSVQLQLLPFVDFPAFVLVELVRIPDYYFITQIPMACVRYLVLFLLWYQDTRQGYVFAILHVLVNRGQYVY